MRKRTGLVLTLVLVGALALTALASYGTAALGKNGDLKARKMSGYFEAPSVSTTARGTIEAKINNNSTIEYKLTYSGLTGTVQQGHIHFAQPSVSAGISAWLCETAAFQSPSTSTPTCPQSGSVSGIITSAEVIGPAGQGIAAGEIGELIAAMKAGFTYANVHTTLFPGGELRGQVRARGNDGDDD